MHTVRKNNSIVKEANILVYAEDQDILWKYRNMLNEIKTKSPCRICITLTGSLQTALSLSSFLQGGIDVYLSDSNQRDDLAILVENKIRNKYPECHCIQKKDNSYIHKHVSCMKSRKTLCRIITKGELENTILKILVDLSMLVEEEIEGDKSR